MAQAAVILLLTKMSFVPGAEVAQMKMHKCTNPTQSTCTYRSILNMRAGIRWYYHKTVDQAEVYGMRVRQRLSLAWKPRKLERTAKYWRAQLHAWKHIYWPNRIPHWNDWMCIHRGEGAWNDPGAPYYGGLQMDLEFQQTYGPEFLRRYGTADNWPPVIQVIVAERAWQTRGWEPWPNTARACGLL